MSFSTFDTCTKKIEISDMEKTWENLIIKAIKDYAAGFSSIRAAAEHLGISYETFKSWHDEKKSPTIKSLSPFMEQLGIVMPSTKTNLSIRRVTANAPVEKVTGPRLKTINVYSVAGAGPAIAVNELEPLFQVTAPPDYFRRSDYAIVVDGHSMEPLIAHGSIVGVKLHAPFVANELYVARIPYEGLVIKRVGVDRTANEFVFKSENPNKENYPDFRLNIDEAEGIIVGRVVWVMWGY